MFFKSLALASTLGMSFSAIGNAADLNLPDEQQILEFATCRIASCLTLGVAFAAPTFEQVLRATPYLGNEVLPAIEAALEAQGMKVDHVGQRFTVTWDGDTFEAIEWFSAENSWKSAKIVVKGSQELKFVVYSIEVIDQRP